MTLGDMKVRRVRTRGGEHIEPPLDETWSELTQLRWMAAVVHVDSGVRPTVWPAVAYIGGVPFDRFCVNIGRAGHSSAPFDWCWTFLNGISAGARAARDASRAGASQA